MYISRFRGKKPTDNVSATANGPALLNSDSKLGLILQCVCIAD